MFQGFLLSDIRKIIIFSRLLFFSLLLSRFSYSSHSLFLFVVKCVLFCSRCYGRWFLLFEALSLSLSRLKWVLDAVFSFLVYCCCCFFRNVWSNIFLRLLSSAIAKKSYRACKCSDFNTNTAHYCDYCSFVRASTCSNNVYVIYLMTLHRIQQKYSSACERKIYCARPFTHCPIPFISLAKTQWSREWM